MIQKHLLKCAVAVYECELVKSPNSSRLLMNIRSICFGFSLCISYLHVKINQNHVRPISVKTTFPLMNPTIPFTHSQTRFFFSISLSRSPPTFIHCLSLNVQSCSEEWEKFLKIYAQLFIVTDEMFGF